MVFGRGFFRDAAELDGQAAALTLEDIHSTANKLSQLMTFEHQPNNDKRFRPDESDEEYGIVQVLGETFSAAMIEQRPWDPSTASFPNHVWYSAGFPLWIPHGWAESLEELKQRMATGSTPFPNVWHEPKAVLIGLLKQEAKEHPAAVGPPFTLFLLRADGSIQDFSEPRVCKVPSDALYKGSGSAADSPRAVKR